MGVLNKIQLQCRVNVHFPHNIWFDDNRDETHTHTHTPLKIVTHDVPGDRKNNIK